MIDSRAKRMSAIFVGQPWRGPMVYAPDVGFGQAERQAAAFMYSGILAGAAVIPPATHFWKLPTKALTFDNSGSGDLIFDTEI